MRPDYSGEVCREWSHIAGATSESLVPAELTLQVWHLWSRLGGALVCSGRLLLALLLVVVEVLSTRHLCCTRCWLKWCPKVTTQTLRTHQSQTGICVAVCHPFLPTKQHQRQQAFLYCLFLTKWFPVHGFIGLAKLGFEEGKASFVFISAPRLLSCIVPMEWQPRGCHPHSVHPSSRVLQSGNTAPFQNRKLKPRQATWVAEVTQQRRKRFWFPSQVMTEYFVLFHTPCDLDYNHHKDCDRV